jgi:hypothetical protein
MLFFLYGVERSYLFNFIISAGIPSCIYCFVSKYKYDKLCAACGHTGVFGNSFNLGHTLERGQRPHLVISPLFPFGKFRHPHERFLFLLYFTTLNSVGFPYTPGPTLTHTILIGSSTILRLHVLEYWFSPRLHV